MYLDLTPQEIRLLKEAGITFSAALNYSDAALLRLLDRIYRAEANWARQPDHLDALTNFRAFCAIADKILTQRQDHVATPPVSPDALIQQIRELRQRTDRLEQRFRTDFTAFQIRDFWCFMPGSSFVFRIYPWVHGNAVILEFAESPIAAEHYDFTDRSVFHMVKMNEEEMFQAITQKVREHDEET